MSVDSEVLTRPSFRPGKRDVREPETIGATPVRDAIA